MLLLASRVMPFRAVLCVVVLLGAGGSATAQSVADKAAAESLFREGRKLMEAGATAQACEKFATSQRLAPAVGSLLNLAACEEKLGRTASAWVHYQEANAMARRLGDTKRAELAAQRAATLEPMLARLEVRVPPDVTDLEVRRDGTPLDPAVLGTAVPVDPGRHVIEARAPGRQPWSKEIEIAAAARVEVLVPALERVPLPVAPKESAAPAAAPIVATPVEPVAQPRSGAWRTVGYVALGLAAVGAVAGTVFVLNARSQKNEAERLCGPGYANGTCADPKGLEANESAGRSADLATGSFMLGGVGLAGAAAIWFTGRF